MKIILNFNKQEGKILKAHADLTGTSVEEFVHTSIHMMAAMVEKYTPTEILEIIKREEK